MSKTKALDMLNKIIAIGQVAGYLKYVARDRGVDPLELSREVLDAIQFEEEQLREQEAEE